MCIRAIRLHATWSSPKHIGSSINRINVCMRVCAFGMKKKQYIYYIFCRKLNNAPKNGTVKLRALIIHWSSVFVYVCMLYLCVTSRVRSLHCSVSIKCAKWRSGRVAWLVLRLCTWHTHTMHGAQECREYNNNNKNTNINGWCRWRVLLMMWVHECVWLCV